MKTSKIAKIAQTVLTAILIITPIVVASKVIHFSLSDESQPTFLPINEVNEGKTQNDCTNDLLFNASFAIMIGLMLNIKNVLHIGII